VYLQLQAIKAIRLEFPFVSTGINTRPVTLVH